MPLFILGAIVVLGGCLLLYYQLGPKVTLRLKNGLFGGGPAAAAEEPDPEGNAAGEAAAETGTEPEAEAAAAGDPGEERGRETLKAVPPRNQSKTVEKVIYVYGDGEREERTLRDNDGQEEDK